MQKRIALLYDFDYTLAPNYMHSYGLMQEFGFNDCKEFFKENDKLAIDPNMDMCLSLMCGILEQAKRDNKIVTKEFLNNCGKNIQYYEGVTEWFDKINKIGAKYGYVVEHFIISSGLKELLDGSSIAKHFKRIYANFYAYKNDEAFWPSQVVNYTSKTQYIYRVRKNILDDLGSVDKINEKMADEDCLPFENIIYLGDSETDIPSFTVIKNSGGLSICVYENNNPKARKTAQKCFIEGRVNYFTPADYREGSDLYNLIKDYIENICLKK